MRYRASSLCILRRGSSILLEQFPEEDGVITYRPVGGTIEYGEDSKSAVVREVKEEIDVDIIRPRLIGLIENIFPYYNEVGHEYDFIYEAEFCSPDDYDREVFEGVEGDKTFAAVWMNLSDFADNPRYMLVPEGLYDMLARKGGAHAAEILHLSTRDYVAFESK